MHERLLFEEVQAEALVRDVGGYARLLEHVAAASGRILNVHAFCVDVGQVLTCSECGITECAVGGWVAFRRFGDSVAWIPDLARWHGEPEHGPPPWLVARGAAVFSPRAWSLLREASGPWPDVATLPPLAAPEAVRVLQITAPGGALGRFPQPPRLRRDALVAAVRGEVDAASEGIRTMLQTWEHGGELVADPCDPGDWDVYVDVPGTPRWAAFTQCQGRTCLRLEGEASQGEAGNDWAVRPR